ncbi:MAG: ATP-binding protein [Thermodesulfobacteriota bacterium]|nr:ATP-binding protein [Thermodesulfobacteriota bacterium]
MASGKPFQEDGHRPPKLSRGAKCTRCRGQAVISLPSHHALFCPDCYLRFFQNAVRRAMKQSAVHPETPLLVAVSGGKDSLAAWSVLHEMGYRTRGLHVDLGIEGFSEASADAIERFAAPRGLAWSRYALEDLIDFSIPEIRRRTRRKICSVCGLLKRQLLNRLTVREGFGVLVTGHNLDDEAGRLLGNLVRHRTEYLEKQSPFLPSTHPRLPVKIKPLYRVEAHEIRIYCELSGIEPLQASCPLSRGATSHVFKEALAFLEMKMPGTKRDFLFTYLERNHPAKAAEAFGTCRECGEPCYESLCSVCNFLGQLKDRDAKRNRDEPSS